MLCSVQPRPKPKRRNNFPTQEENEIFLHGLREKSAIRETLRQWEAENNQPSEYAFLEALGPGEVANHIFKSEALSGMREGRQVEEANDDVATDETGPVESLTTAPTDHLHPGALIELR